MFVRHFQNGGIGDDPWPHHIFARGGSAHADPAKTASVLWVETRVSRVVGPARSVPRLEDLGDVREAQVHALQVGREPSGRHQ